MQTNPLVTCVCPTRNHRAFLSRAIACFLAQTYEHRELMIIADGEEGVADLVPADPRIRLMVSGWEITLSEKRNIGCQEAFGELIAHWDDSDVSAPPRLAAQVARLAESRRAVTGYSSMRFTDGVRWWRYDGLPSSALAGSLCYQREWWKGHQFVGEESEFVEAAARQFAFVSEPARDRMYGMVHAGGVSGPAWQEIAA